jgi:2-aminoadipate transaminase
MIDYTKAFATIAQKTKASAIRELLKITGKPGVISFAGGLPDPNLFPVEALKEIMNKVLSEKSEVALQYGATDGIPEFKQTIANFLKEKENMSVTTENILVTSSSQQALDIVGRTFLNPKDPVLVELPSYLGALQAFQAYDAELHGVRTEDDGIILSSLEEKLSNAKKPYKFAYVVSDFQNPAGMTLGADKRKKLIDIAHKYNILLIEDLPYRPLRFEGQMLEPMVKTDNMQNTVGLFSLSKTLAPGFRLGFIVANKEIINKMTIVKQSMDLCTSNFSQLVVNEFLKGPHYEEHVNKIRATYKGKKDAMLSALQTYMPEGVTWTKPEGGMFLFVRLPENMNADEMFPEAIKENVAYVIGSSFHCDGSGKNTMRLNFSYPTKEEINEGIKRLAEVVKKNCKSDKPAMSCSSGNCCGK